ncbi:helix-turn-helix domain-containing protein [Micromonospora sp. NPDC049679]|uniref:helix-turn-helix domain-containing protein n=1 Tax=Micromonospora sp. NPDC049679 TaxID=3155920 RepID=UPI0033C09F9A
MASFVSVAEAADQLGVDPSLVRRLLRSGALEGDQVGLAWLVDRNDLARRVAHRPLPRRPMAARRAWGLLLMLAGLPAPWLDPAARSKVRAFAIHLAGGEADVWRAALRARAQVDRCWMHPAALQRLAQEPRVAAAGASAAMKAGADLVVVAAVPEFYVPADLWPQLRRELHVRDRGPEPNVIVRVPHDVWPFAEGQSDLAPSVLAADLVESGEDRAARAGAEMLNRLAGQIARRRSGRVNAQHLGQRTSEATASPRPVT